MTQEEKYNIAIKELENYKKRIEINIYNEEQNEISTKIIKILEQINLLKNNQKSNIIEKQKYKDRKIELEDFELESNELYPLTKFTYNNYSRDTPIKQGFDFSLKANLENIINSKKNEDNYLFYFYFILSNPSLSISDKQLLETHGIYI